MKKLILVLFILVLFFPHVCRSQEASIFADFIWNHDNDKTVYWVLTDPNSQKYNGTSDIAIEVDTNVYLNEHLNIWLQEIYDMNTDANIPDWVNTHLGKYQQALTQIGNIDSWAEFQVWAKKVVKVFTKINPVLD